jgi:hypothetical protein
MYFPVYVLVMSDDGAQVPKHVTQINIIHVYLFDYSLFNDVLSICDLH